LVTLEKLLNHLDIQKKSCTSTFNRGTDAKLLGKPEFVLLANALCKHTPDTFY